MGGHVQRGVPVVAEKKFRAACVLLAVAWLVPAPSFAQEDSLPVPDVLVYKDGDRVQGRLLAREGDLLVFRSVRFGDLRVPANEAEVVTAGIAQAAVEASPAAHTVAPPPEKSPPAVSSTPDELTKAFKDFFGPWHGRFSLSAQIISDTSDRSDFVAEATLRRNWLKDELSNTIRYEYSKTNEIITTNIIKGNGLWRHTLPRRLFTVYRPAYEWNRAYENDGIIGDYILLQQEVGLGVTAIARDDWNVRVGLAENFFDTWATRSNGEGHTSAHIESFFIEADLKLPWRITVTERAVFYYAIATGNSGWEHQFEVTKKLTETLSLGLRQEARYNDPDLRSQDYSLLRFLLGFDF